MMTTNPEVDKMYKNILCRYKQLTKSIKTKNSYKKKAPFLWSHLGQAIYEKYYRQYRESKTSVGNEIEEEKVDDSDYGAIRRDIHFQSSNQHHLKSNTTNYRVFQFGHSSTAAKLEKQMINPLKQKNSNYLFIFRSIRKCDENAHRLCGYVQRNEAVQYELDTVNRTDPISKMIKEKLVSKDQCKIKLLLLMGCHSYYLAMIFKSFVENIICIHPHSEIEDEYSIMFNSFLHSNLTQHKREVTFVNKVRKSFCDSVHGLAAYCNMGVDEVYVPQCMQVRECTCFISLVLT